MKDKRTEKTKNHYNIFIDEKPFKVMNYSISNDNKSLSVRTKIRGQSFPTNSVVVIKIPTLESNIVLQCKYKFLLSSPVLEEWKFEIVE